MLWNKLPGEPSANGGCGWEVEGKAPVPCLSDGAPLRHGLPSPGVPSRWHLRCQNDNLLGGAPAVGFPTAFLALSEITPQIIGTITPHLRSAFRGPNPRQQLLVEWLPRADTALGIVEGTG